jgi:transposase
MNTPPLTITNEQVNSLPLLLAIIEEMGIRPLIHEHLVPHGQWEGASVGTVISIWLCHILQERDHRLVVVRDWVSARMQTLSALVAQSLRATDCTDDRLANILTMLGDPVTQARLDAALLQRWLRLYRLPTDTVRLDSTTVSVYHDEVEADSLLQLGLSKDHRPDLRQFKLMLATLDPLGMPLCCQMVGGNRADDPLYLPAYQAAVATIGTRAVLIVGDSKMATLATRGPIVAGGSSYLCPYHLPAVGAEIAAWVEQALARATDWQTIETLDPQTGELHLESVIDSWEREQQWADPISGQVHTWNERVLVVRSTAYQTGLRRHREQAVERLTESLLAPIQPPGRCRKGYRTAAELEALRETRIAQAEVTGVVGASVAWLPWSDGQPRWVVSGVWVDLASWQALVDRLGWRVYVTNTSAGQYDAVRVISTYHGQAIHERGFARLKTRNLQMRPLYLRDEQRMAGLVWVLCLALRVLTLTEHRVRTALMERQEAIVGLNPASRTQATARPTTERVIAAFDNLTLTTIEMEAGTHRHVTPLNATQRHILVLLTLPTDLYERLAQPVANLVYHLRE